MKPYTLLLCAPLLWTACSRSQPTSTTQTTGATVPAPDNTRVNDRDKSGALTPVDQSNDPADIAITQRIRQAIMADDSLSFDAKNVKVITTQGVVTLRGPVMNESERSTIAGKAAALAGTNRIDDQLDVEQNKNK